ncbi:hypothetical protein Tco_0720245 [Tanacetum coccineum]
MLNPAKLEFLALDISEQNYLSWVLDVEIYLAANGLGDTIQAGKETTVEQKAKAMIFLCHHLHENLKFEYLTVKDSLVLWNHLKDKYEHKKTVILPRARYNWVHLRFQDFKTSGNTRGHKRWQDKGKMIKNDGGEKAKGAIENGCYRYGSVNHWARACRTPKHLVELYQRSQKNKEKRVEVNFTYQYEKINNFDIDNFGIDSLDVDLKDQNDTTHLDVSDFLTNE